MSNEYRLVIHDWLPCKNKRLEAAPWPFCQRLREADAQRLIHEARQANVPKANGKRRVSLHLILGARHCYDMNPEDYRDSLLAGLERAGLILDSASADLAPITIQRGRRRKTIISLLDFEEEADSDKGKCYHATP
jgi:hypothetical protein